MNVNKEDLLLYAVTDRSWLGDSTLIKQVKDAIKGGTTFIQLREKDLNYDQFLNEAYEIKELCKTEGIPFIINDNVKLAIEVNADGVHIGQDDMSARQARKLIGNDKILGVSAQTVSQAIKAQNDGADYLGVGAIHPTDSKSDADVVGLEELSNICSAVDIPVVAIGGINKNNLQELEGTGIAGISVISAIFAAEDIKQASQELKIKCEKLFQND